MAFWCAKRCFRASASSRCRRKIRFPHHVQDVSYGLPLSVLYTKNERYNFSLRFQILNNVVPDGTRCMRRHERLIFVLGMYVYDISAQNLHQVGFRPNIAGTYLAPEQPPFPNTHPIQQFVIVSSTLSLNYVFRHILGAPAGSHRRKITLAIGTAGRHFRLVPRPKAALYMTDNSVPYLPQSCEAVLENPLIVAAILHLPLLLLRHKRRHKRRHNTQYWS